MPRRPVGTTDAAADLLSEAVGPIRLDVRSAVPPPVATAPAQPAPAQDVADPFGPVRTEPTVALPSAPLATEACAPSVPVVEADRDGNLLVQWQTPPWAVGGNGRADAGTFELQWRREGDGEGAWRVSDASASLSACRVRLHGLREGSRYWVRVRALGRGPTDVPSVWIASVIAAVVAAATPPPDVSDAPNGHHQRAPSDSGVAAATASMLSELRELGLSHDEAATALRASGMRGVAAAADWHFTTGAVASPAPPPPAPLIPNLLD